MSSFPPSINVISLGSGSAGNSYYIYADGTGILIDCGISSKQIFKRLQEAGFENPKIHAVFVTHEHIDHVASCRVLENKTRSTKYLSLSSGCQSIYAEQAISPAYSSWECEHQSNRFSELSSLASSNIEILDQMTNGWTPIESSNSPMSRPHAPVQFYMTRGTYLSTDVKCLPSAEVTHIIEPGQWIRVGELIVECFSVPHDGVESVCYRAGYRGSWVGVITDLGHIPDNIINRMRSMTTLVLEFNYDPIMLRRSEYPAYIQDRICSDFGHLSNQQAAEALLKATSPRLQNVLIGHISRKNNLPELAKEAAELALLQSGFDDGIRLHICEQHQASPVFSIVPSSVSGDALESKDAAASSEQNTGRALAN